jgi:hypothetical protein
VHSALTHASAFVCLAVAWALRENNFVAKSGVDHFSPVWYGKLGQNSQVAVRVAKLTRWAFVHARIIFFTFLLKNLNEV